jgi:2-methylisocitrate lyase-like PEP mutase family enzyme
MSAGRAALAAEVRKGTFITAPGVFDMISAKVADAAGFKAIYMTGFGTVASYLGLPDAGIATYTDMVARAGQIARGVATPLIADADTGYGGNVNVRHTVRGYEAAGVAAIQIEDQALPKKCGHMTGHRLVPTEEMVAKIKVACDSRASRDFLIIGRTDARKAVGEAEAFRRCEAYVEAGCDILFYEAPASVEEMRKIARTFDVPLIANMVEGGATPVLTPKELEEIGFRIAIFPAAGFLAAADAMRRVYSSLKETGRTTSNGATLYPFKEFATLMGFDEIVAFEDKYG